MHFTFHAQSLSSSPDLVNVAGADLQQRTVEKDSPRSSSKEIIREPRPQSSLASQYNAVSTGNGGASEQTFVRTTRKYLVRMEHVGSVKEWIGRHLPAEREAQTAQSVYLDNERFDLYRGRLLRTPGAIAVRIRWYGSGPDPTRKVFVERKMRKRSANDTSVKERFRLNREVVGDYIAGKDADAISGNKKSALRNQILCNITANRLKPVMRSRYVRTAYQVPKDFSIRLTLDTNLEVLSERPQTNITQNGVLTSGTSWCRRWDDLYVNPLEVVHFGHAILETKTQIPSGEAAPQWLESLLRTDMVHDAKNFSKFTYGCASLFRKSVPALPMHSETLKDFFDQDNVILSQ